MCLVSKTSMPSVSKIDIPCYKILVLVGSELRTPYRDFLFPIDEVVTDTAEEDITYVFDRFLIEGGFFHSFTDLDVVKNRAKVLKCRIPKSAIKIYNAIIPKGTTYYQGEIEKDICSKSLKIIDECND